MTALAILDQEFLSVRAKLLEVAATLDRLDRAHGSAANDRRIEQIRASLEMLLNNQRDDRAEQIQLLFSRPYDDEWQEEFGMTNDE